MLAKGGNDHIRKLIEMTKTMQTAKKVAMYATITALIGGIMSGIWQFIKFVIVSQKS